MKPIVWFLRSSAIYFFISVIHSTATNERKYRDEIENFTRLFSLEYFIFLALIFDPYTRQVYNWESGSKDTWPRYPYIIACPAEEGEEEEKELNQDQSLDHKALFAQSYYEEQDVPPARTANCETSIQLAAVNLRESEFDDIEFGYEVFVY